MEQKNIVLAFFDILGTSKLLSSGELQRIYGYYVKMAELCSDTTVPILLKNVLYGKKELVNLIGEQKPFVILQTELKNAFFSDTFIIWSEIDGPSQIILTAFFEKCAIIFCEALKQMIPLRGTISVGTAVMDEEQKIFLGKPLAEAAKGEVCQNWLGMGFGKSFRAFHSFDTRYVLPYSLHRKTDKKESSALLNEYVLDWPRWWREHESECGYGNIYSAISKMNTDSKFSQYYEYCLRFYEYSENGDKIWEEKSGIKGITKQAFSDLVSPFLVLGE